MPKGTQDEKRAKLTRQYMDDKLRFVNARKCSIGACAECDMAVTESTCHAFSFAHVDASSNTTSVSKLCNGHATLASTEAELEAEMERCRLLCAVCHSRETRDRNTV